MTQTPSSTNSAALPWSAVTAPGPPLMRFLLALQWLQCVVQFTAIAAAWLWLTSPLPYGPLIAIASVFVAWNLLFSLWHWRNPDSPGSGELAFGLQLSMQILVLTGLLYYSGGGTSPFVSLYLLPIAIGALSLRFRFAALLCLFGIGAYTLLLNYYVPLAAQHMHGGAGFNFHVIGMWINFLLSAVVILIALSLLSQLTRQQSAQLAAMNEQALRDAHVVALGGIAAGTAHSLSTPLSTVAIVLDELLEDDALPAEQQQSVALARDQVSLTRDRLTDILKSVRLERVERLAVRDLHATISRAAGSWHLLHPQTDLLLDNRLPERQVQLDPGFQDSLTTLLDNAAEANRRNDGRHVWLRAYSAQDRIIIEVEDEGGGPPPQPGRAPVDSEKPNGAGFGLLIVQSNVDRLGGDLQFFPSGRGCLARLAWPLAHQDPVP